MKKYVLYFLLWAFVFLWFWWVLHSEVLAAGWNWNWQCDDCFDDNTPTTPGPSIKPIKWEDLQWRVEKPEERLVKKTSTSRSCWDPCDWIKLNTCFPIIWDCIETKGKTDATTAFPTMLSAITKIVMSIILVVCFILIIVSGIMRAADKPEPAKKLIKRVAITILLLWFSGVILKLVNPNFFS